MPKFDLNIEKILEDWEPCHAVREIIANALDEQKITNTEEIRIFVDSENVWHIRDYGRGIKYEHLTQNESNEKHNMEGIVGKFGIGLKDALATFDRHDIRVKIVSRYVNIELCKSTKAGFEDIITLHANITEPFDTQFIGTEVFISGIDAQEIEKAKQLFLQFSGSQILDSNNYGEIIKKRSQIAFIYINGVQVAEESNFLFSYNIKLLNAQIKKALNRERTNVGRTAYAQSVKSILLNSTNSHVLDQLIEDFNKYSLGTSNDEMKWIDIQSFVAKKMSERSNVVFITSDQIQNSIDLVNEAKEMGRQIVVVPSNLSYKIDEINSTLPEEEKMGSFNNFVQERNDNFEFCFIPESKLTFSERSVWKSKDKILKILGNRITNVKEILISSTMQKDIYTYTETVGLWQPLFRRVIILRSVLKSKEVFLSTLIHEIAHASSGADDSSRPFEKELSDIIGILASKI